MSSINPRIELKQVRLVGGPRDGCQSLVSHLTAVSSGEVYVWDGSPGMSRFVYAKDLLHRLTTEERSEFNAVAEWMEKMCRQIQTPQPPSRPWLLNLAVACSQNGIEYHETGPKDPSPPPFQD